ncbi:hypothetical protein E2C01_101905 [Portunus trituberculatus]|uniref:Uncharacterized protein n=1 Tax=Portunus trituberculatus TaxID=210409 RepID=A0A5B7KH29_PORTR|nr:hypothetical protein [Portunus trituberculatus]
MVVVAVAVPVVVVVVVVVVEVVVVVVLVAVTRGASGASGGEAAPWGPRACHLPPGAMRVVGRSGRSAPTMWWWLW